MAWGVFSAIGFGLALYFKGQTDWSRATRLGIAFGLAAFPALLLAIVPVTLPTLELLVEGGRPTYQRWRARIFAAAATVTLGVVASVIAAWLS